MSDSRILLAYKDDDGNYHGEAVWGAREGDYYRIKNIPIHAKNIAYDDLVAVKQGKGILYFERLIRASGHSVVQMIIFNIKQVNKIGKELVDMGCEWVKGDRRYLIAVHIPKDVSYVIVREWLERGVKKKRWDYKELSLSHDY